MTEMTVSNKRLERDANGNLYWAYDVSYEPAPVAKKPSRLTRDKDLSELFGVTKPVN